MSTMEEIALHQEELEAMGPILGRAAGKTLRILLLQNNVIDRMEPADLKYFRKLEYLNLAINNISIVRGVAHLEFLEKLDLTLNFIHFDSLRDSLEAMAPLRSLKELYLMGNPCYFNHEGQGQGETSQHGGWRGYRDYVIAKLPQLLLLDGQTISRSERFRAHRNLEALEEQLAILAQSCKQGQAESDIQEFFNSDANDEAPTKHCPQVRLQMSHEIAAQKSEKEKIERANQPQIKGEQEALEDQLLGIERARLRDEQGEIRPCNGMT